MTDINIKFTEQGYAELIAKMNRLEKEIEELIVTRNKLMSEGKDASRVINALKQQRSAIKALRKEEQEMLKDSIKGKKISELSTTQLRRISEQYLLTLTKVSKEEIALSEATRKKNGVLGQTVDQIRRNIIAEKKLEAIEEEKNKRAIKNEKIEKKATKTLRKKVEVSALLAKRMNASNEIMKKFNLTARETMQVFSKKFGMDHTRKELKHVENSLKKVEKAYRNTSRKAEESAKIMQRGAMEATRETSFLNSKLGTLSIVMSGIAATLFVWQEFLQLMRMIFSETIKIEKAMAKMHAAIRAPAKTFEELRKNFKEVSLATGSEFDKTAEAFTKLAKTTNSIQEAMKYLPSVMQMVRSDVVDIDTAIEEAVYHTYGLEKAWKKSGEAAKASLQGAGQRVKDELKGLIDDILNSEFIQAFLNRIADIIAGIRDLLKDEPDVKNKQDIADQATAKQKIEDRIKDTSGTGVFAYNMGKKIGEKFWHGDIFQGIIYPSLAMKANSDNIAIKSECVDEYLELEEIEHIRIDKKNDELNYDITILDTSGTFDKDGSIIWRGGLPQWTLKPGSALEVKAEKGRWVAKDDKGNEAKPGQTSSSRTSVNGSAIITPLRYRFDRDFNKFLNTAAEHKVTNVKTGDITAYPVRVHFDFDNYSKFVSIYIPKGIDPFAVINFYIGDISQALKVGDGLEVHQRSDDNSNTTSSKDLTFNGSLFIYTEVDLTKKSGDALLTCAKKKGIELVIRGSNYLS